MAAVDYTFADSSAGQVIFESSKNGGYKEVFDETHNQTALLLSSRDRDLGINSAEFYFEHELDAEYVAGAGFDGDGRSRASIYYNAFRMINIEPLGI